MDIRMESGNSSMKMAYPVWKMFIEMESSLTLQKGGTLMAKS